MSRRLHTEILEGEFFTFITDWDQNIGEAVGLRIIENNTKFSKLWAKLDAKSREISRIMQGYDS